MQVPGAKVFDAQAVNAQAVGLQTPDLNVVITHVLDVEIVEKCATDCLKCQLF